MVLCYAGNVTLSFQNKMSFQHEISMRFQRTGWTNRMVWEDPNEKRVTKRRLLAKTEKKIWRCITGVFLPRENVMHFWPLDKPESVFWVCLPHEKVFHQLLMVFVCPLHVQVRQEFNQGPVRVTFHMVLVGQHPTNLKVECKEKIGYKIASKAFFTGY